MHRHASIYQNCRSAHLRRSEWRPDAADWGLACDIGRRTFERMGARFLSIFAHQVNTPVDDITMEAKRPDFFFMTESQGQELQFACIPISPQMASSLAPLYRRHPPHHGMLPLGPGRVEGASARIEPTCDFPPLSQRPPVPAPLSCYHNNPTLTTGHYQSVPLHLCCLAALSFSFAPSLPESSTSAALCPARSTRIRTRQSPLLAPCPDPLSVIPLPQEATSLCAPLPPPHPIFLTRKLGFTTMACALNWS